MNMFDVEWNKKLFPHSWVSLRCSLVRIKKFLSHWVSRYTGLSVGGKPSFFKYRCVDFIEKKKFFTCFFFIKLDVKYKQMANFMPILSSSEIASINGLNSLSVGAFLSLYAACWQRLGHGIVILVVFVHF